jgi:hypothetical protein
VYSNNPIPGTVLTAAGLRVGTSVKLGQIVYNQGLFLGESQVKSFGLALGAGGLFYAIGNDTKEALSDFEQYETFSGPEFGPPPGKPRQPSRLYPPDCL